MSLLIYVKITTLAIVSILWVLSSLLILQPWIKWIMFIPLLVYFILETLSCQNFPRLGNFLITVGIFLNALAMGVNGFRMPYFANLLEKDPEHFHSTHNQVQLWWICDSLFGIISPGDLFLVGGIILLAGWAGKQVGEMPLLSIFGKKGKKNHG